MMENHEDYASSTYSTNRSTINKKSSPIKSSTTVPASQTKIGFIKSQSINTKQFNTKSTTQFKPFNNEADSTFPQSRIELSHPNNSQNGGSLQLKQNRSRRYLEQNASKKYNFKIDESKKGNLAIAVENFVKKIGALEGKIKEISKEKQQITELLTEKIQKLQEENNRLTILVRNSCKEVVPNVKLSAKKQFDLEEMLSAQINMNLQLREQNERISLQLNAEIKKFVELENSVKNLELQKHEKSNQIDIQAERQSFIIEKQMMISDMEENKREIESLRQKINLMDAQKQQSKKLAETLKVKIIELQGQQCKKCKELLHTIFRLNSQLNKK